MIRPIQSGASSASRTRADHRPVHQRLLSSLAASTSTFALVASRRWSASAVTLPGIGPTMEEVLTAFVRGHALLCKEPRRTRQVNQMRKALGIHPTRRRPAGRRCARVSGLAQGDKGRPVPSCRQPRRVRRRARTRPCHDPPRHAPARGCQSPARVSTLTIRWDCLGQRGGVAAGWPNIEAARDDITDPHRARVQRHAVAVINDTLATGGWRDHQT